MYCCWNVLLDGEVFHLKPTSKVEKQKWEVDVINRNVIKKVSSHG